jgi:probable rRNA maturation factor
MRDPDRTAGDRTDRDLRDLALLNPNRYAEAGSRRLRPWLQELLRAVAPEAASFTVRFCGDREMRRTNRQYRGFDKTTDVLSFPGDGEDPESAGHLGDVLISVPMARRQAAEAGHSAEREIRILILHGVLHCLGYDHETDQGEMERLERKLRRSWIPEEGPDGHA